MNFKHYIQLREEPIPEVGLYRQHRDPERTKKSYQKAKERRDKVCFHHQLVQRCQTYKAYKRECYKIHYVQHVLNYALPNDVTHYLLEFYSLDKKVFIPTLYYHNIGVQDKYKWYILISNILSNIKEPYHQNILNLHKQLNPNNYSDSLNDLIKHIEKQKEILKQGKRFEYKSFLNAQLYSLFIHIRL
jgi:hypothetical protein